MMIYPLTRAKNILNEDNNIPPSWRYSLFGILLEKDRLVREDYNVWFFLQCCKKKLIPNFITNLAINDMPNSTMGHKYVKVVNKFYKKILNMTISDSFRKLSRIKSNYQNKLQWLDDCPERLRHQTISKQAAIDYVKKNIEEISNYHEMKKKPKLIRKIKILSDR